MLFSIQKYKRYLYRDSRYSQIVLCGVLSLIACYLFFTTFFRNEASFFELSYAEYSHVLGAEAGSVIPASCESGETHANTEGCTFLMEFSVNGDEERTFVDYDESAYLHWWVRQAFEGVNFVWGTPLGCIAEGGTSNEWDGDLPFQWAWPSTSGGYHIFGYEGFKTIHNLTISDEYTITCGMQFNDGYTQYNSETVQIDVGPEPINFPPVLSAGPDRVIVLPVTEVTPSEVSVADPEGERVTVIWDVVVKPLGAPDPIITDPTTLTPTFTNLVATGTYVFQLTATDDEDGVSTDMVNVIVNAPDTILPPLCTGFIPPEGHLYVGDDTGLATNTPYIESATDTPTIKCEYFFCALGTTWDGMSCVAVPVLPENIENDDGGNGGSSGSRGGRCTGQRPQNTFLFQGDNDDPLTNTPVVFSSTKQDTSAYCEFICMVGVWDVTKNECVAGAGTMAQPILSAEPRVVRRGDTTNLRWNLNNQLGCTLTMSAGGAPVSIIDPYADPSIISRNVRINANSTFILGCDAGSASVRVDIIPISFET